MTSSTELESLRLNLERQGQLLDQTEQERERLQKELKKRPSAPSQIDNILKAAKCTIVFHGWKSLADMKKITSDLKDKETITDLKNLGRKLKIMEPAE